MSEYRLPKLKEDNNHLDQAKYAIQNMESIGGILTCLSIEKFESFVRMVERQKENEQN